MLIRKKYRVESAHIVRNCSTDRCKKSVHGHSAIIEVILRCDAVDNAQMVMDFSLFKKGIKPIIDAMDHTIMLCKYDDPDYLRDMKKYSERFIIFPFNPSAEMLALWLHISIDKILQKTDFKNGEGKVYVHSVKYHETESGYAETERTDIIDLSEEVFEKFISDVKFSDSILNEINSETEYIYKKNTPQIDTDNLFDINSTRSN